MRNPNLFAAAAFVVLSACQPIEVTQPLPGSQPASAEQRANPPADGQILNVAQLRLNRYGFPVDAYTLTRDQLIRINRIDTWRKRAPEIRREISAILARSQ